MVADEYASDDRLPGSSSLAGKCLLLLSILSHLELELNATRGWSRGRIEPCIAGAKIPDHAVDEPTVTRPPSHISPTRNQFVSLRAIEDIEQVL